MLDVHSRVNDWKRRHPKGGDPIVPVAQSIMEDSWVLCLDEMQGVRVHLFFLVRVVRIHACVFVVCVFWLKIFVLMFSTLSQLLFRGPCDCVVYTYAHSAAPTFFSFCFVWVSSCALLLSYGCGECHDHSPPF